MNTHSRRIERDLKDKIGHFLVEHDATPHVEEVDQIRVHDRDVRQEAVCRCLRMFHKQGCEVTDDTVIDLLYQNSVHVLWNFSNARVDAIRSLRGRGSQRGKDTRVTRIGAQNQEDWDFIPESDQVRAEEAVSCQQTKEAFEAIENDFSFEIQRLYDNATPTEQKAIRVLVEWQCRKDEGRNCYPLRKTVHKLKKKLTEEGSSFDLSPKFL